MVQQLTLFHELVLYRVLVERGVLNVHDEHDQAIMIFLLGVEVDPRVVNLIVDSLPPLLIVDYLVAISLSSVYPHATRLLAVDRIADITIAAVRLRALTDIKMTCDNQRVRDLANSFLED